mmetsp:Transcript_121795/g.350088  ORF Transcript_121795/g.350088 Transcript_121795/m.350088 type:complete len:254 (-) Transcript_121795:3-764(-)
MASRSRSRPASSRPSLGAVSLRRTMSPGINARSAHCSDLKGSRESAAGFPLWGCQYTWPSSHSGVMQQTQPRRSAAPFRDRTTSPCITCVSTKSESASAADTLPAAPPCAANDALAPHPPPQPPPKPPPRHAPPPPPPHGFGVPQRRHEEFRANCMSPHEGQFQSPGRMSPPPPRPPPQPIMPPPPAGPAPSFEAPHFRHEVLRANWWSPHWGQVQSPGMTPCIATTCACRSAGRGVGNGARSPLAGCAMETA